MSFEEEFPNWKGFDWGKLGSYQKDLVQSHIAHNDLDKSKVKKAIDKELGIPHMQQARQLGKTWLLNFFVQKKKKIYAELGLK